MAMHEDIKALLKRLKVRQKTVSERLDLSQSYVSDMLSGKSQITANFLEGLADMLDMTTVELLANASGEEPKENYRKKALEAKKTLLRIAEEEQIDEAPVEFTLMLYTNLMIGAYSEKTLKDLLLAYKMGLLRKI